MDLNRLIADAILAFPADAVAVADRDGIIQVWNPGAERDMTSRFEEIRSLEQKLAEAVSRANGWGRIKLLRL